MSGASVCPEVRSHLLEERFEFMGLCKKGGLGLLHLEYEVGSHVCDGDG